MAVSEEESAYLEVENDIAVAGDVRIAVIGVGGAGCRVASMVYNSMSQAKVIAINTDKEALAQTSADVRLYICKEVTKGVGTHGDYVLGKKCAQIHDSEIMATVSDCSTAVIVAGMGGGTGTGAAAVVAELCDRVHVKVVAMAVMPFSFESMERQRAAAEGFRQLHVICKDVIRIENERILSVPGVVSLNDAMDRVNDSVVACIRYAVADAAKIVKNDMTLRMRKTKEVVPVQNAGDGSNVVTSAIFQIQPN